MVQILNSIVEFLRYLKSLGIKFIDLVLISSASGVLELASIFALYTFFNSILLGGVNENAITSGLSDTLGENLIPLTVTIVIITAILKFYTIKMVNYRAAGIASRINKKILESFERSPNSFRAMFKESEIISLVSTQSNDVLFRIILPLMNTMTALTITICLIAALGVVNYLALISITVLVLVYYYIINRISHSNLQKHSKAIEENYEYLISLTKDMINDYRQKILRGEMSKSLDDFVFKDEQLKVSHTYYNFLGLFPKYIFEAIIIVLVISILSLPNKENSENLLPILATFAFGGIRILPNAQIMFASFSTIKANLSTLQKINRLFRIVDPASHTKIIDKIDPDLDDDIIMSASNILKNIPDTDLYWEFDLILKKGEVLLIDGPSGCGKTTLVDSLLGFTPLDSGIVRFNKDIKSELGFSICYIKQNQYINNCSIGSFLGLEVQNYDKVALILEKFGLDHLGATTADILNIQLGDYGDRLSGGELQRLHLCKALLLQPSLLIIDEGTNAIDKLTEAKIFQELIRFNETSALIFITHSAELKTYCNKRITHNVYDNNTSQITSSNRR